MRKVTLNKVFVGIMILALLGACATDEVETITEENNAESTENTEDSESIDEDNLGDNLESVLDMADQNSELVVRWSNVLLEVDQHATGMRPNATARALAYIHLALYETAVADLNGYASNTVRFGDLNIDSGQRPDNLHLSTALNACYAHVLDHFIYNVPRNINSIIERFERRNEEELRSLVSNEVFEDSKSWGRYVAKRVIAYSQTDLEAEEQILDPQPTSYEPAVGDGFWTYSADEERGLFPYWSNVRTFVISTEETSSIPPEDEYSQNTNSNYYAQMYEVYETNNRARDESNEELWIAEFWSDDVEGLMISPPGRQISIAKQLIAQYDLSLENALTLLLKLGFSLNDAAVSTWDDKYNYLVMRPNVYIQEFIDPDFQTNLYKFIFWPNPTFPGYPSGHSCFASAAAGIFMDYFGNSTDFTDRTYEGRTDFLGDPRQFSSFTEMAEENAFSRIPLGVHIRMDCTEGLRLGYEISDAVNGLDLSASENL